MPTLPSGRTIALAMSHILEPGTQMFSCPPGHYWYQTPDRTLNAPPFQPGQEILCSFEHAPCPTTREEALLILVVLEATGPARDRFDWRGYTVGEPEALADLTPEDRAAWDAWVASPDTQVYLDRVIDRCHAQDRANRGSPGYVVLRRPARGAHDPEAEAQRKASLDAVDLVHRAVRLERETTALRALPPEQRPEQDRHHILHEILVLLTDVDAIVDDPERTAPAAWHARGIAIRLLDKPAEAERCFMEAARQAPGELDPWLELTRIRAEQGKFGPAEDAARRAVEIDDGSAKAWANLASVLMQAGCLNEARMAAERALGIDRTDPVAGMVVGRLGRL